MGKSYKAPAPPDPYKTAAAQQSVNLNTALANAALNQYEEVTPYGRTYYEPTGDVRAFGGAGERSGSGSSGYNYGTGGLDSWQRLGQGRGFSGLGGSNAGFGGFSIPVMRKVTEFSPEQQRIFNAQMETTGDLYDLANAYVGRVGEGLNNPFTFEGLPEMPDVPQLNIQANDAARQQVIDSVYGQLKSRLDPEFDKRREAMVQNLANRGISVGSDAWKAETDRFDRARNDAYMSAMNQAITTGGAEQSRLFNLDSQLYGLQGNEYNLGVAARERAAKEREYLRNRPIDEINALTTGRGLTPLNFGPPVQTNMGTVDLANMINQNYQYQVEAAQRKAAAQNSMIGSITGTLGGLFGLSDERLKTDIEDTGYSAGGVPVKTWRWKGSGEPDSGVVAQDVERLRPDAAVTFPGGVKGVNYGRLFGLRAA